MTVLRKIDFLDICDSRDANGASINLCTYWNFDVHSMIIKSIKTDLYYNVGMIQV